LALPYPPVAAATIVVVGKPADPSSGRGPINADRLFLIYFMLIYVIGRATCHRP
jgi:hypothetical protein